MKRDQEGVEFEKMLKHIIEVEMASLNETGLLKLLYYAIGLAEEMDDERT